MAARGSRSAPPVQITLAPIVLIKGPEGLLVDRASSSRQPRSVYGKIVAEADRDIDIHEIFLRAIEYGEENYPGKGKEEQWQRFADHMDEKYSRNGYIKLWIPNSPNEKALKELRNII